MINGHVINIPILLMSFLFLFFVTTFVVFLKRNWRNKERKKACVAACTLVAWFPTTACTIMTSQKDVVLFPYQRISLSLVLIDAHLSTSGYKANDQSDHTNYTITQDKLRHRDSTRWQPWLLLASSSGQLPHALLVWLEADIPDTRPHLRGAPQAIASSPAEPPLTSSLLGSRWAIVWQMRTVHQTSRCLTNCWGCKAWAPPVKPWALAALLSKDVNRNNVSYN